MSNPIIEEFFNRLDQAKERADQRRAEIEQLREQIATAASEAATLRLTANAAYRSILTIVDEIEMNRIMTTEERKWAKRLEQIAKDLNPYPEERDE